MGEYPLRDLATFTERNGESVGLMLNCPNCGLPGSVSFVGTKYRQEYPGASWHRTGDTLDTISLTPSVLMHGHFHSWIRSGKLCVDSVFFCQTKVGLVHDLTDQISSIRNADHEGVKSMQDEIAAGQKVKVAMTMDGVTTVQDAEVLSYADGVVHINLNGETVSVDPSQIVTGDAPAAARPAADTADAKLHADLLDDAHAKIDALTARAALLEGDVSITASTLVDLQTRVEKIEAWIAEEKMPAPAAQNQPHDESTAAAESGEAASGS